LRALQLSLEKEGEEAASQGLSAVSMAVYDLLESVTQPRSAEARIAEQPATYRAHLDEGLKAVSLEIETIMRDGQKIIDWENREDVQRIMRRDIKRELRKVANLTEEELDELARRVVDIARSRLT
jgi:hypothetical protein